MMMDLLLQAAGVDVKWWNYKTECCGASVGMPKMEIQRRLSGKILEQALAAGADAIVVCCPLCHVNLDLKQAQINSYLGTDYKVPILYLSQVLGLALGLSAEDVMLQQERRRPDAAGRARPSPRRRPSRPRKSARRRRRPPRRRPRPRRRPKRPRRRRGRRAGRGRRASEAAPTAAGRGGAAMRIGVFVCHCGSNIAGTVDVAEVAKRALTLKDVVHAENLMYTCSEPGQAAIQNAIKEKKLDRVVVAACSPHMHEVTFRRCVREGAASTPTSSRWPTSASTAPGSTPTCRWPPRRPGTSSRWPWPRPASSSLCTPTRWRSTRTSSSSAAGWPASRPLSTWPTRASRSPSSRSRPPSAGSWPSSTRPSPPSTARPASSRRAWWTARQHENITLMTYCEVEKVSGYVGNFTVDIRKKASMVDWTKCIGCEICVQKCPAKAPDSFNVGLEPTKAIYIPFPQAVPKRAAIQVDYCRWFQPGQVPGVRAGLPGRRHRLRAEGRDRPEASSAPSWWPPAWTSSPGRSTTASTARARSRTSSPACSTSGC